MALLDCITRSQYIYTARHQEKYACNEYIGNGERKRPNQCSELVASHTPNWFI
ncbi:hypothetical protein GCM10027567_29290 [Spongiibacter taiwanensis]